MVARAFSCRLVLWVGRPLVYMILSCSGSDRASTKPDKVSEANPEVKWVVGRPKPKQQKRRADIYVGDSTTGACSCQNCLYYTLWCSGVDRDSDWLRGRWSGDRIPVGTRFFAAIHTGPEVQPASCTMGTGSFLGIKRPGRGVDHPPHLAPRLKKE